MNAVLTHRLVCLVLACALPNLALGQWIDFGRRPPATASGDMTMPPAPSAPLVTTPRLRPPALSFPGAEKAPALSPSLGADRPRQPLRVAFVPQLADESGDPDNTTGKPATDTAVGQPATDSGELSQANQASRLLSGRPVRPSLRVALQDDEAKVQATKPANDDALPVPAEADQQVDNQTEDQPPLAPAAPMEPLEDLPSADEAGEPAEGESAAGDFPNLPPDPEQAQQQSPLPDLHEEIYHHGGSYLYAPEGDRLGWPEPHSGEHFEVARLPEDYVGPEPLTLFADFLGADPIRPSRHFKLPGHGAYGIEPRFVGYGSYSLFHSYFVQNGVERHLVGHNANVELDLRLTGTERFHVQFRPLAEGNTGGSFFSIEPSDGYIDNSTVTPTRYWVEGALDSLFGAWHNGFSAIDYNFVVGKFPLQLQNNLLINDEILGVVLAKNNIYLRNFSNINAQVFYGFNDVNVSPVGDGELIGGHLKLEYRYWYLESSYAHVNHDFDATQDADWAALSMTRYYGPWTVTGRALFKWGDEGGSGSGNLFTLEANKLIYFDHGWFGAERAIIFANAFSASEGWESIANANLNRIRTSFEVNPLTQIAAGGPLLADTAGVSIGAQFFFHHDDQSLTPEFAFEAPGGDAVWGYGVRYLRKVGEQSFLEVLSLGNFSDNDRYDRAGVFSQFTILF